jgi:hypothetical protein
MTPTKTIISFNTNVLAIVILRRSLKKLIPFNMKVVVTVTFWLSLDKIIRGIENYHAFHTNIAS